MFQFRRNEHVSPEFVVDGDVFTNFVVRIR
jgi:hypothetical protein